MSSANQGNKRTCGEVRAQVSDFLDSTLSGRKALEIEKHLTECADCAAFAQQMEATVRMLRTVERYDTDDDFMAKLHMRLDALEPERARKRFGAGELRDWLAGIQEVLWQRRGPAFGLSMGVTALAAVVFFSRPITPLPIVPPVENVSVSEPLLDSHVALTASNPFDDPVAANLETHAAVAETSTAGKIRENNTGSLDLRWPVPECAPGL